MSEERKILDMIEKGQITAEDGMKLLEALRNVKPEVEEVEVIEEMMEPRGSRQFKYLKVRVLTEKGDTKVNVNIPMKLVKAVGGVLPHINSFIPDDVQDELDEKKALTLTRCNWVRLLKLLNQVSWRIRLLWILKRMMTRMA